MTVLILTIVLLFFSIFKIDSVVIITTLNVVVLRLVLDQVHMCLLEVVIGFKILIQNV